MSTIARTDRVPEMGEEAASCTALSVHLADCFASATVSNRLATRLQDLFPDMVFLRACIRCGTGVFVTSNLLKPGPSSLTLVSVGKSLCGMAMKAGQPVAVTAGSVDLMQVYCAPISVAPPNGTTYAPLQVGALMGGVEAGGDWDTQGYFLRLAATCGPAFLNVALSNVEPLSHFLSLRDSDTRFLSVQVEEEEDFQDIPSDLLVSSTELDVQHAENVEVARPSTSSNQSSRASLTLAPSTPALDQVAGCAFQDRCSLEDKRQEHEKEVDEAEDGADSYGSKGSLHSNSSSSQVNWKKSSNMWRARSIAAGLFIMLIFVSMVVWVWTVDGRRDHSHLLPWSPGAGSLVEL